MSKENLLIHFEWLEDFEEAQLTEDEQKELLFAAIKYARNGENPTFSDRLLTFAWMKMRRRIDSDIQKYEDTCNARSKAGKKGGAPKGNSNASRDNETDETSKTSNCLKKQANAFENKQMLEKTSKTDEGKQAKTSKTSDTEYVTVTDTESDTVTECECVTDPDPDPVTHTHTREAVKSFFREQGFRSDPDAFIDYNIGRGNAVIFDEPVRWQAVARNWERKEDRFAKINAPPEDGFDLAAWAEGG